MDAYFCFTNPSDKASISPVFKVWVYTVNDICSMLNKPTVMVLSLDVIKSNGSITSAVRWDVLLCKNWISVQWLCIFLVSIAIFLWFVKDAKPAKC